MTKTLFLILYNILRFLLYKIRYGNRYRASAIQRISPFCALKIFDHGTMEIGRNTELAHGCDIEVHGKGILIIGDGTYMNRYCMVSAHCCVRIGCHCMFGPGVKIFDNNHKFSREKGVSSELKSSPVSIGDRCWIASDVIILKGTTIGNNCVIGAGCVVSGNFADGTIVKLKQDLSIDLIGC